MSEERERRLQNLREELYRANLDGLVVSAPADIFYLSGFRGSSASLLVTADRSLLFSDFRYRLQAARQAPSWQFVEVPRRLFFHLGRAAAEMRCTRLGFDTAHVTCEQRDELAAGASGCQLVPAPGMAQRLRAVKSEAELATIRTAAALADEALSHILPLLRPGATEREVALEAEFYMRRHGAEAAAFDVIVASGPNSALPHAIAGERELEPGDLVVIDIGAKVGGYCSDMTRTYAIASASPVQQEIYRVVYEAQSRASRAVLPGAICHELDAVARSVIEKAGYGDYFGHGLGHGVGIEVHESPRLGRRQPSDEEAAGPASAPETLVAGNVVTVEPGIYLPEVGGVRLENLLVVTSDGAECLTKSPLPPELPIV